MTSTPFAAFNALIQDRPPPELVVCDCCDATTACPELGIPAGWDATYGNEAGWSFTCPDCLEGIEEEWGVHARRRPAPAEPSTMRDERGGSHAAD